MENSNFRIIDASTIKEMLVKHEKALKGNEGGELANFYNTDLKDINFEGANLSGANFERANLTGANLEGANLKYTDLDFATLEGANLRGANLERANLRGANLRGANLTDTDLDFATLPLWCGSLKANFDDKQIIQLIYHAVKAGLYSYNTSDEVKNELEKVIDLANKFHRVEECGRIERSKL